MRGSDDLVDRIRRKSAMRRNACHAAAKTPILLLDVRNNTAYAVDAEVSTDQDAALVISNITHPKSGALCQANLGGVSGG